MTLRPWHWLLAVVALVVPIQAVALGGGDAGGGALTASASLGGCGVSQSGIACEIDVSWSGLEGADHYTAAATLADGSVQDLGTVGGGPGGGSTAVWVPYVGDGDYGISITAWGADEAKKLDKAKAEIDPATVKPDTTDEQANDGGPGAGGPGAGGRHSGAHTGGSETSGGEATTTTPEPSPGPAGPPADPAPGETTTTPSDDSTTTDTEPSPDPAPTTTTGDGSGSAPATTTEVPVPIVPATGG